MSEKNSHNSPTVHTCVRCGGGMTPATTFQSWREHGDYDHWPNRTTVRCDLCAQALRDYFRLPNIGRGVIMLEDRPLQPGDPTDTSY